MDQTSQPDITSFVLRFIHEPDTNTTPAYRGSIRHVQTDDELSFTDWQDAVNFIRKFIPINTQPEGE